MVDVVLAKLESETDWSKVAPPFGILYVAHALEQAGRTVRLFHRSGSPEAVEALLEVVRSEKPAFVGFSVITGPGILPALRASERIKEATGVPIVWEGLHATMLPEVTLKKPCIDFVALGEGEPMAVPLAEALGPGAGAGAIEAVPGLAYRKNGGVCLQPPAPFLKDLDSYKPAWHLLDRDRYFYDGNYIYSQFGGTQLGRRIATMLTSRGCPWRCAFCYNQAVDHRHWRMHSVARVLADLRELNEQHGISGVVFEDDCFFTDLGRALEIAKGVGVPWSSSMRADTLSGLDDEYLSALKAAGCAELRVGAESGSEAVLGIIQKDITPGQIRRGVAAGRRHRIHMNLNFMVGMPGETWDDVLETLDLMDELDRLDGVAVNGPSVYGPWPGTALYDEAVRLGYEPPRTIEGWGEQCWTRHQPVFPFQDRRVRFIGVYRRLAKGRTMAGEGAGLALPLRALGAVARARWRRRFFGLPLDIQLPSAAMRMIGKS